MIEGIEFQLRKDATELGVNAVKQLDNPEDAVLTAYIVGFINGLVLSSHDSDTANMLLEWLGRPFIWRVAQYDQWFAEWRDIINNGR